MILDKISNSGRIEALHPGLKTLFDYIKSHDLNALPMGRTELDGNRVFINRAEPELLPRENKPSRYTVPTSMYTFPSTARRPSAGSRWPTSVSRAHRSTPTPTSPSTTKRPRATSKSIPANFSSFSPKTDTPPSSAKAFSRRP